VHGISTSDKDISGPFEITGSDLRTAEKARAWLKKHNVAGLGLTRLARHTDCGGWVFFPMRRKNSSWWSISIRLDVAQVLEQAKQCKGRHLILPVPVKDQ